MAIGPALITAGANLLGSLLGRKKSSAQGVDYVKLRNDAEAAGFNPLTALLAGGGAGYQREFNPALSSGAFVAEAINRGVDTYFNQVTERDAQVDQIRQGDKLSAALQRAMSSRVPGSFGYALSDQRPFVPTVSTAPPPMTVVPVNSRPPKSPLAREPEYIPVRMPDGQPGRLERSIAGRLDIKPWDTVSAGDWAEIVGEITGEAETALKTLEIRDTATRQPGPFKSRYDRSQIGPAGTAVKPPTLIRPSLGYRGFNKDGIYQW